MRVGRLALVLGFLAAFAPFGAARADDFRFSVNIGDDAPRYAGHHRGWDHHHRPVFHRPAPPVWERPVIYHNPAPVITPPPRVVYVASGRTDVYGPTNGSVFVDQYGRTCRWYENTRVMYGRVRVESGKACLYSDGQWHATP